MAALAVDLGAAVLVDRVVTGEQDGSVADAMVQDESDEDACQGHRRPVSHREDVLVAGGVAVLEFAEGAEEIGDGAAPGGEDCGDGQDKESLIGGMEEGGGELIEQRASEGWYTVADPVLPTVSYDGWCSL
jgi:hypothetical protein